MKYALLAVLLLAGIVTQAFSKIEYTVAGPKKGKVFRDFRPSLVLMSLSNSAVSPRELQSGKLAPGHRKWASFQIANSLAKNSPLISPSEVGTKSIRITASQVNANGKSKPLYTIILDGATLTKNEKRSTSGVEKYQITFQKIQWTWNDGGITFKDTWLPVG